MDHLLLKTYVNTPTHALNPIAGERTAMWLERTVSTIMCLNYQCIGCQHLPYLSLTNWAYKNDYARVGTLSSSFFFFLV